MSGLSDRIEAFILELLSNEDSWLELRRNELAEVFSCVPSQINYVISTRFNEDNGYIVESRRGGGGYLKIRRIDFSKNQQLPKIISAIGDDIDFNSATSLIKTLLHNKLIDEDTDKLINSAISDRTLFVPQPTKNKLRACILKSMLSQIALRNNV